MAELFQQLLKGTEVYLHPWDPDTYGRPKLSPEKSDNDLWRSLYDYVVYELGKKINMTFESTLIMLTISNNCYKNNGFELADNFIVWIKEYNGKYLFFVKPSERSVYAPQ